MWNYMCIRLLINWSDSTKKCTVLQQDIYIYIYMWHIIFITTNKRTLYIKTLYPYIIYTTTCFDISLSSSGNFILVRFQVTQIVKIEAVKTKVLHSFSHDIYPSLQLLNYSLSILCVATGWGTDVMSLVGVLLEFPFGTHLNMNCFDEFQNILRRAIACSYLSSSSIILFRHSSWLISQSEILRRWRVTASIRLSIPVLRVLLASIEVHFICHSKRQLISADLWKGRCRFEPASVVEYSVARTCVLKRHFLFVIKCLSRHIYIYIYIYIYI